MAYNITISNVTLTADKIKVMWGDVEYVCNKQTYSDEDWWYYGAPYNDDTGEFDFSDIPFGFSCEDGENYINVAAESNRAVDVQIAEVIETEAVWKKVGGGSSPTPPTPAIDGDLENGCTIQPSAWVDGEVDVPFYQMLTNQQYRLYLDGEYIKTETPETDELTGGTYLEYEFGSSFLLSFSNTPGENTTHVAWNINPPQAVTIRLECELAIGPGPGDDAAELG